MECVCICLCGQGMSGGYQPAQNQEMMCCTRDESASGGLANKFVTAVAAGRLGCVHDEVRVSDLIVAREFYFHVFVYSGRSCLETNTGLVVFKFCWLYSWYLSVVSGTHKQEETNSVSCSSTSSRDRTIGLLPSCHFTIPGLSSYPLVLENCPPVARRFHRDRPRHLPGKLAICQNRQKQSRSEYLPPN